MPAKIALIAAVPAETTLLRQALSPCEVRRCGHLEVLCGRLEGQEVLLVHSGIGKANAAGATAVLLQALRPGLVLNFGVGGAYGGSRLEIGSVALASREIYGDEGVAGPSGFLDMQDLGLPLSRRDGAVHFNTFPVNATLLEKAANTLGLDRATAVGPFVTVSCCSGTTRRGDELARRHAALVENMEGAAVAQLCLDYRVPFLELRGISNPVADRRRERWDLPLAAASAQQAVTALLPDLSGQEELA